MADRQDRHDPFESLLRAADESWQPGDERDWQAAATRTLAQRRQRRAVRRVGIGALAALALAAGLHSIPASVLPRGFVAAQHPPASVSAAPSPDSVIAVARRTRELLRDLDRTARLRAASPEIDVLGRMRVARDEAAYTLVAQADRLLDSPQLGGAAIELYEQTVRNFPESTWAADARRRLAETRLKDGGA